MHIELCNFAHLHISSLSRLHPNSLSRTQVGRDEEERTRRLQVADELMSKMDGDDVQVKTNTAYNLITILDAGPPWPMCGEERLTGRV